ncbi:LysR substrate-binding domain-containing protein [Burkholderia sp. TSV86]|uniref:LysR substrate-binding domain-containing protein n=1 Tax=Burkholderia sp. TSV86 TaxID=1385594 RepID=UPI002F4223E5
MGKRADFSPMARSPRANHASGVHASGQSCTVRRFMRTACSGTGLFYPNRALNGIWRLPPNGESKSLRIGVRVRTDSGRPVLTGAGAGLGLAIVPAFAAFDARLRGELVPVLTEYALRGGQVSILPRKSIRSSARMHVLLAFLAEEVGHCAGQDLALIERGILP